MKDQIIIYSATWCGFCKMAKNYLDSLKIPYTDLDVEASLDNANSAVAKSGQRGIPVIDIAGEIIVGFDKPKIDSALKSHGLLA